MYNHKVGNKIGTEKKWNKLTFDEQKSIIEVVPIYLSTIKDKQFQAHAETWLNQRRWENEDLIKIKNPITKYDEHDEAWRKIHIDTEGWGKRIEEN